MVMASHGRAPWYGPDGRNVEAYVIGIAGGSASGKVSYQLACLNYGLKIDKSDISSSSYPVRLRPYPYCLDSVTRCILPQAYGRGDQAGIRE